MAKNYKNELNEMYRLMNYSMDENKKAVDSKGIVEYSQLGADGKTYGILKEGNKYYVKVAPAKHTKVLAEDFDYVGGFNNRKSYNSYTKASNALNMQLLAINEATNSKKSVSQYNINECAEWQTGMTKEAREELNRFYQLTSNVDKLLSENVHYIKEEKNGPFTNKPSNKNGGGNNGKSGSPNQNLGIKDESFVSGDNVSRAKTIQKKYQDGKGEFGLKGYGFGDNNVDEDGGNAYQDKPQTPNIKGGRRSVKLSESQKEQVLAWMKERAFVNKPSNSELDRSHGTSIGDTSPWTDTVNETFDSVEWDGGIPGSAGVGDAKKYRKPFDNMSGVRQPVSEQYIFEVEIDGNDDRFIDDKGIDFELDIDDSYPKDLTKDDAIDIDSNFGDDDYDEFDSFDDDVLSNTDNPEDFDERIYSHLGKHGDDIDSIGFDTDDDILSDIPKDDSGIDTEYDDDDYEIEVDDKYNDDYESDEMLYEMTLNDFGRHPAYRKKPMTLPQNADASEWGEDWNDESAKGDKPYGSKIGHSGDPFTDKVNSITNSVVTALAKKKI